MPENKYHEAIRALSERLVTAQRPIRILDALKWDPSVEEEFYKKKCKELPKVRSAEYYAYNPFKFDIDDKIDEFNQIERDIRRELGQYNSAGSIMRRMCREYSLVLEMLRARGTPQFSHYSQQLYGSSEDAFYAGAPRLRDMALLISEALASIQRQTSNELDHKCYTSEEAVSILNERLNHYFLDADDQTRVKLSDDIVADAAAGAENIKIRSNTNFSERDLKVLEVHEGWVHLGTTLNGLSQPICTFLSKGPPSSTVTQEGLAIIMEIFTFSSHPARLKRITDRITAIQMAENGANFLEIFNFFTEQGLNKEDGYIRTMRVFRGSTADGSPFTKDLVYSKGFVLIYNYIRLIIQKGHLNYIPLLFLGKTTLEDLHVLSTMVDEGLLVLPKYVPPQFADMAALCSWMSFSLFLNQLDLKRLAIEYKDIL